MCQLIQQHQKTKKTVEDIPVFSLMKKNLFMEHNILKEANVSLLKYKSRDGFGPLLQN